MKWIIHGKTYNTETSKKLGHSGSAYSESDKYYHDEWLYVTKKGTYSLIVSNTTEEHIEVINESIAKDWMEKYGDFDEYVKAFGEPEEG